MSQPETFSQLVDTLYDCRTTGVIPTPAGRGDVMYPDPAWLAWEWQTTLSANGYATAHAGALNITTLPDTVVRRNRQRMAALAINFPRPSRI